ncbi:MAG: radical SAM protein [Conexivisphaerales archaeon]
MAKYVLLSDLTLLYNYRNFPLLDFLPCAPSSSIPHFIYSFLKGNESPPMDNGEAKYSTYSIRKIESSLLNSNRREEVAVPHFDYIDKFIGDDTEIIGVSTMDPLGLGPLTMSYTILFNNDSYAWVRREWEALLKRINSIKNKKSKLVVGGPGVWEFTIRPEELDKFNIDYAVQGEIDDVAPELFSQISDDQLDKNMFYNGYISYDENFSRLTRSSSKFISRRIGTRMYPALDQIPDIIRPTMKDLTEVMRGCGVGCDFCEVTLRPLRYYPIEKIRREIEVNVRGGSHSAWLHSDEIFAYMHGKRFEPNYDALVDLFTGVMTIPGILHTNPTHGRISIPAGYPDLIKKLSDIMGAGPDNWIGVQVGLETGSEKLAKIHMPNKTLPLKVGSDGSWQQIVWKGVYNMNLYYWRPAFTVQVGQVDETDEDNWETVSLINKLSNSEVNGRPFEFTVTPMQNIPLGLLKSREFSAVKLSESQLAVYYASYRHLAKMAARDAYSEGGGNPLSKLGASALINLGGRAMLRFVESICRKGGLDIEKVKNYGLGAEKTVISPLQMN